MAGSAGARERGSGRTGSAAARERGRAAPSTVASVATAGALVAEIADHFSVRGVPDARREARDLVAALADQPRFWPSLEPHARLAQELVEAAWRAVEKRLAGAPFAYAVGRAAFRHLTLRVDERVLIPRQETELLVELVLSEARGRAGLSALDVGTGSGAIALALATEGEFNEVVATDVSEDALALARANAEALGVPDAPGRSRVAPLTFLHGADYAPVGERAFDVIAANPPYIAFAEVRDLPASVRDWEPAAALACGGDGLDVTRRLVGGAPHHLRPGGLLALEVDERRARVVASLAQGQGLHDVRVHLDLTGRERFVTARRI
jgi:release factor glutamine methyltransferase